MKFQEDNKHSQKRLHGRETFEFSPWKRDQPQAYIERLKHCKHREPNQ